MKKVVVGLSGGVDSAVCAKILLQKGFDVYGLFLDTGISSKEDAEKTAAFLNIPFIVADIREALENRVCKPFEKAYLCGKTPNPCIICNPAVKFKALYDEAKEIGAEYIATGHYARVKQIEKTGEVALYKAKCLKDQSYMLYRLPQNILKMCLFPLGEVSSKEETRKLAKDYKIPVHAKKDSMEICFIPDNNYAKFIENRGKVPKPGQFIDEKGNILGMHKGIHHYTIGQRKGLGISADSRLFVQKIDVENNQIVLSNQDVFAKEITVSDVLYCENEAIEPFDASIKIRHSIKEWDAVVYPSKNTAKILFKEKARAPAPGQSAVFYRGDRVIGGGFIE